jgi:hypothetical protein
MATLLVDPPATENDELYTSLYGGAIVLFSKVPSAAAFAEFAREQLTELFAPHSPEEAHLHHSPEELAELLGPWKPRFIHDDRSKAFVRGILAETGFPAESTYFDVPKPRTAYPVGSLTTGIAFAFPWHRDTWYAAPAQQINWWMPIFGTRADNGMQFDFQNFDRDVPNDSDGFDYYEINRARATTAKQVGKEVQSRPRAIDHEAAGPLVPVLEPGSILLFSAAQLHGTVPNTSPFARYSIDFRTVDRRHVEEGVGAPMGDVNCTGTAIRDFMNAETGERLDEEFVRSVYGAPPEDAVLVYGS